MTASIHPRLPSVSYISLLNITMMRNTFGNVFTLTSFGESHGEAVGGVIDGMPAGIEIDKEFIQHELERRRPGQSALTTSRKEPDQVELLSGVFEGKSTGAPIGFVVRNTNHHSQDYENLRCLFRPSHADYTYYNKYGLRDHRGGGRSSARITISRCVGGALAKLALRQVGVSIAAYTSQVGDICTDPDYRRYDIAAAETNPVRCPDSEAAAQMEQLIRKVKAVGDTIGGVVTCVIKGCPPGLGEPEFGKLHGGRIATATNHSGGIQGGISNGEDIYFRVAFKPVATVLMEQQTVDMGGEPTRFTARGRHDSCVVPRAVPVVEAMAAMTLLDYYLMAKTVRL